MNELDAILDCGSGDYPVGTTNIDLYPRDTLHRHEGWVHLEYTPNFVNGDIQYLPFKDNSFDLVTSSHVIEHVDDPVQMLREMYRVSRHKVEILCPHRYGLHAKGYEKGMHKSFFKARWFEEQLPKLGFFRVRVSYPKHRNYPLIHLPSPFPEEIYTIAQVHKITSKPTKPQTLYDILACPFDHHELDHIKLNESEGLLYCPNCQHWFPVRQAIPEMLPTQYRNEAEDLLFLEKWQNRVPNDVLMNARPFNLRFVLLQPTRELECL